MVTLALTLVSFMDVAVTVAVPVEPFALKVTDVIGLIRQRSRSAQRAAARPSYACALIMLHVGGDVEALTLVDRHGRRGRKW